MSIPAGVEHTYAMEAPPDPVRHHARPGWVECFHEVAGLVAEERIFPERGEPVDRDRLAAAASELDIAFVG